jgi:hypothetical protein
MTRAGMSVIIEWRMWCVVLGKLPKALRLPYAITFCSLHSASAYTSSRLHSTMCRMKRNVNLLAATVYTITVYLCMWSQQRSGISEISWESMPPDPLVITNGNVFLDRYCTWLTSQRRVVPPFRHFISDSKLSINTLKPVNNLLKSVFLSLKGRFCFKEVIFEV